MSIFGKVFGTDDLDNLIDKVDTVIDSIPQTFDSSTAEDLASDAVRQYLSSFSSAEKQDDIHKLIGDLTVPADRINRYNIYDEIYRSVQLVKKIIRTYTFNILQQDLITGRTYIFGKNEDNVENDDTLYKSREEFVKEIFKFFDLEKAIRNIVVPSWLRYGDFFIHIVDLEDTGQYIPKVQPSLNPSKDVNLLTETKDPDKIADLIFDNCFVTKHDVKKLSFISEQQEDKSNSSNTYNLNRIALEYIKPHNVVILKTTTSNMSLGYVYLEEVTGTIGSIPVQNPTLQMANVLNQISGGLRKDSTSLNTVIHKLSFKLIDYILKEYDIPQKLAVQNNIKLDDSPESRKEYEEFVRSQINNDDIYYLIKEVLFCDPDKLKIDKKRYNVRFIPSDRMIHIQTPSSEYYPYGESIIDPLVYPAKLYLINQLANVVIKLSRAAVIRKWIVETGPRDIHSSLLQKLRREFRNQRITANDILSFKSIPRILSDFKDLVVFSKKGQRFVDVETTALGDPNTKIQDVEDSRRELISTSGVPAAYLGQADVVDLRDQLVNANIAFANDIAVMQNILTDALEELVNKISDIFFDDKDDLFEPCRFVNIKLTPPVILMLQLIESTISSIGNIFQTFQSISDVDVDPYYLLERYMPYIDWESFKEAAKEFKVKTATTGGEDENQ